MVSDFFYPNCGGVETHIYQLSQCLMALGHKVVVVTRAYGSCSGVRYLTNGLKVYYVPRLPFYSGATLPTVFGSFSLLRCILVREAATVVHAHQAFSTLGLEACLHARTMGYKVVFTDHSLFGFADLSSIFANKLLKCVLADVHAVLCVSYTSKENTVLRACLPPAKVAVIPNAVDATQFQPDVDKVTQELRRPWPQRPAPQIEDAKPSILPVTHHTTPEQQQPKRQQEQRQRRRPPSQAQQQQITLSDAPAHTGSISSCGAANEVASRARERDRVVVVAMSRLVYRKGIDLLALVIPHICATHPHVDFIIGGDGPKRRLLEVMVRESGLHHRVRLAGAVPGEQARTFLTKGHIFVNASLTEAFCISIVEAACVGLLVVSTNVGGVPEVLPPGMAILAEPSPDGLLQALEIALERVYDCDPLVQHQLVRHMYNWHDVAARTALVYDGVAASRRDDSLSARLCRYAACGPWAGTAFCLIVILDQCLCWLMRWWQPDELIERAVDWPC